MMNTILALRYSEHTRFIPNMRCLSLTSNDNSTSNQVGYISWLWSPQPSSPDTGPFHGVHTLKAEKMNVEPKMLIRILGSLPSLAHLSLHDSTMEKYQWQGERHWRTSLAAHEYLNAHRET
jgi:hypothetical protein